jgi:hypothetical protein
MNAVSWHPLSSPVHFVGKPGRIFALIIHDTGSTFYGILRTYSSGNMMREHSSLHAIARDLRAFCLLAAVSVTYVQAQVDFPDHPSAEADQRWFPIRRMLVVQGRPDSADQLGSGFAMLPDANGDGWNDLAVSAQNRREMLIFYGGPEILDSIPDAVMPGGGTIATGDFNGDSLQDIAVQQPSSIIDLATGESIGSVPDSLFVYFAHRRDGCIYGPNPDLRLGVSDTWGTSRDFGYHCASGDFNGDGIDDLITGAPGYYDSIGGSCQGGRILIYLGDPKRPLAIVWRIRPSLPDSCHYLVGSAVYVADANGDGIADIFGSSVVWDRVHASRWVYTVYLGRRGIREHEISIAQVLENSDSVFLSYCRPIDLTHDGCAELPYLETRSVGILLGGPQGYSFERRRRISNPDTTLFSGYLGEAFNLGDINGNGFDEYALTFGFNPFNGRLLVIFAGGPAGIKDTALTFIGRYLDTWWYGRHTVSGDFNGDGLMDFCSGAATRQRIYPETRFHRGDFEILEGDEYIQIPLGVESETSTWPTSELQIEIYPTPSDGTIQVVVRQQRAASLTVSLYSITGEQIRRLHEGEAAQELHLIIERNGADTPPGIYYIVATTANNVSVRKVILM